MVGVALVIRHTQAEEAAAEIALLCAHQRCEGSLVPGGANGLQLGCQRFGAQRLNRGFVHEPGIQCGHFGLVAIGSRITRFVAFHQAAHARLGEIA